MPNLGNNCLHKSTIAKFYPITENDKDFLGKIREDLVGGPSIVVKRKAVVDDNFCRDLTNWCKFIVGIDASQLYPFSMCQAMPLVCTGDESNFWNLANLNRLRTRRGVLKPLPCQSQRVRPQCKLESFPTTGTQKKNEEYIVDGFVDTATLCLKL